MKWYIFNHRPGDHVEFTERRKDITVIVRLPFLDKSGHRFFIFFFFSFPNNKTRFMVKNRNRRILYDFSCVHIRIIHILNQCLIHLNLHPYTILCPSTLRRDPADIRSLDLIQLWLYYLI